MRTTEVPGDSNLPVQVVIGDTASRVPIASTSQFGSKELLRTISTDRDDTVDGSVERREERCLGVGHFTLDGELSVNVQLGQSESEQGNNETDRAKDGYEPDQNDGLERQRDSELAQPLEQVDDRGVDRIHVLCETAKDTSSRGLVQESHGRVENVTNEIGVQYRRGFDGTKHPLDATRVVTTQLHQHEKDVHAQPVDWRHFARIVRFVVGARPFSEPPVADSVEDLAEDDDCKVDGPVDGTTGESEKADQSGSRDSTFSLFFDRDELACLGIVAIASSGIHNDRSGFLDRMGFRDGFLDVFRPGLGGGLLLNKLLHLVNRALMIDSPSNL